MNPCVVDDLEALRAKKAQAPFIVALLGAGGKTTSLHVWGRAMARRGVKTVLTTTTKMGMEKNLCKTPEALRRVLATKSEALFGHPVGDGHMEGPDAQEWEAIKLLADVILVEADGAKGLPLKVPLSHEPVLPLETDFLVLIFSLLAIGKPLQESCFRLQRALEILEMENREIAPSSLLTPENAALLLQQGYLNNAKIAQRVPQAPWLILANQGDQVECRVAREVQESLHKIKSPKLASWTYRVNAYSLEERSFWR